MDELRARIEAFRAKSPALARRSHASKSSDDGTNAFKSLDERDERAAPRVAVSPRSPAVYAFANDDDARASVDAALKHLEALSATAPGVRGALELVRRDENGRVTVESFARVAERLSEISTTFAASNGESLRSPVSETTRLSPGVVGAAPASSPRDGSSPRGFRRSASPIGPPQRVRVNVDGEMSHREPASAPPLTSSREYVEEAAGADESAYRLREWGEHVRESKKVAEASELAHRIREDIMTQYKEFMTAGTPPSDPFVQALAEQTMNSIREKEQMTHGVHRARQMIEALSASDKAKTLLIQQLSDQIERLGGDVPEGVAETGIQWSAQAFEETSFYGDEEL